MARPILMCCRPEACIGDQLYIMLADGELLKFTYRPQFPSSNEIKWWERLGNVTDAKGEK